MTDYSAHVNACINHDVRDPRHYELDAKVYEFNSTLEIHCRSTWPEERADVPYSFTIWGHEPSFTDFDLTLDDCHVVGKYGERKYKKVWGKLNPVYKIPNGVGSFEKIRGQNRWIGHAWVSSQCFNDMLPLLAGVRPLYVFIHEYLKDSVHWICGFTLQTNDPAED